jgi:hypothetical protein
MTSYSVSDRAEMEAVCARLRAANPEGAMPWSDAIAQLSSSFPDLRESQLQSYVCRHPLKAERAADESEPSSSEEAGDLQSQRPGTKAMYRALAKDNPAFVKAFSMLVKNRFTTIKAIRELGYGHTLAKAVMTALEAGGFVGDPGQRRVRPLLERSWMLEMLPEAPEVRKDPTPTQAAAKKAPRDEKVAEPVPDIVRYRGHVYVRLGADVRYAELE